MTDLDPDASPREIWSAFNVLVDPISSNVAAINLPLLGEASMTTDLGVMRGSHWVLTYGPLARPDLRWLAATPCFSYENPSVLIAAEAALRDSWERYTSASDSS